MKWLMFLFSLYILALSAMPCFDKDCCKDEITQSANAPHKPEAPCSPFSLCSTCHGFIIPQASIEVIKPVPVIAKLTPVTCPLYLSGFSNPTWQPPKNG